jgi:hypothetical protein
MTRITLSIDLPEYGTLDEMSALLERFAALAGLSVHVDPPAGALTPFQATVSDCVELLDADRPRGPARNRHDFTQGISDVVRSRIMPLVAKRLKAGRKRGSPR